MCHVIVLVWFVFLGFCLFSSSWSGLVYDNVMFATLFVVLSLLDFLCVGLKTLETFFFIIIVHFNIQDSLTIILYYMPGLDPADLKKCWPISKLPFLSKILKF